MKVKRYVGETAQEALNKVKSDLGRDAIILNTRKIRKRGIMGLFSKPLIEVVATIDSDVNVNVRPQKPPEMRPASQPQPKRNDGGMGAGINVTVGGRNGGGTSISESPEIISFKNELNASMQQHKSDDKFKKEFDELKNMVNKVYDVVKIEHEDSLLSDEVKTLLRELEARDVDKEIVNEIKETLVKNLSPEELQNGAIVKNAIRNILDKYIGDPEPFKFEKGKKVIIFIGPTGVGKTTTLAKLAANMTLSEKRKVGLITSDTYRIAAVEQLKTYSEIIGVPLSIIYTPSEILNAINNYDDKDIVMVDTAGRSHKDKYQLMELKSLLKSSIDYEVYLVMSATTKFSDCMEIIKSYSFIDNYKLLFTKTDETSSYGVILNVAHFTKKPLSYVTTGQSVPDDIEVVDKNKIINCLLGDKPYERSS